MVIGYYIGRLRYANPYGDNDLDRRYGEEVISESRKEFHTYAVHIGDDVKEIDGSSHDPWLIPTAFHPLHFINDPRYLEVDRTPQSGRDSNGRQASVEFIQKLFP